MLMATQLVGFGAGGDAVAAKSVTWKGNGSSGVDGTTFTQASADIGTATSDRRVIVATSSSNTAVAPTSVTVGGTGLTHINGTTASSLRIDLWIGNITSGTTADIVVTTASIQRRAIGWWIAYGLTSDTPIDSDVSTAAPSTATLTTVNGGFVVCAAANNVNTSGCTWSGGVTERWDEVYEANFGLTGADGSTTGADVSPSCAHDSAESARMGVFATF